MAKFFKDKYNPRKEEAVKIYGIIPKLNDKNKIPRDKDGNAVPDMTIAYGPVVPKSKAIKREINNKTNKKV